MRSTFYTALAAPFLLALTMGSTDCQSYTAVTVPAVDTTRPLTLDGVWDPSTAAWVVLKESGTSGVVHHLTPGKLVIAVASGLDQGGTRTVSMAIETGWKCCQGSICSNTISLATPVVDTQPGSIGAPVSDGVYVATVIGTLPTCNPGYTLASYRYAWTTTVEDFHGNRRVSAVNQAFYP
jgi:hypothetical protein